MISKRFSPVEPKTSKAVWELIKARKGQLPGQLVIQFSDACNATCPQCELRVSNKFTRKRISQDDLKRTIDAAAARGVQALSFTGGEPFLFQKELFELICYAGQAGIRYIRTGTNGYMFTNSDRPDWEDRIKELAETMAASPLYTFWISIDSHIPAIHEQMRGVPGVIKGIEKALPIFSSYGIYPSANLGINRNAADPDVSLKDEDSFSYAFKSGFASFYEFVIGLGFTIANVCYPMSAEHNSTNDLDSVYGAASSDDIVTFNRKEKALMFQALMEVIPQYRDKIRIFTPLCSLQSLIEQYRDGRQAGYSCRGGLDYHFIDAQSQLTYPCGFRGGESMGKYWELQELPGDIACRKCDWECFRDPSELLGPLIELKSHPFRLAGRFVRERDRFGLWYKDLRYYKACSWFSGRTAPDYEKMSKTVFSVNSKQLPVNKGG